MVLARCSLKRQQVGSGQMAVLACWRNDKLAAGRMVVLACRRDDESAVVRTLLLACWLNKRLAGRRMGALLLAPC